MSIEGVEQPAPEVAIEEPAQEVVEQPAQEVAVTEQAVAPEVLASDEKPKARKEKKTKQARASSHPPYFQVC